MNVFKKITISLILIGVVQSADAQIFKKLGKEVSKRVENKIIREVGDASEKGVDKVKKGAGDAVKGKDTKTSKTDKQNSEGLLDSVDRGMGEIGTNYDFIPGEQTLFETNFSKTVIGNFPQNLEFRGGQLSVVSYSGGRAIKANTKGGFIIKLDEKLPERFTIEFKEFNSEFVNSMRVEMINSDFKPIGANFIKVDGYGAGSGVGAYERGAIFSLQGTDIINKEMTTIRVMVDGSYVKVYAGKNRIANMPNANLGRSNMLLFNFDDVRTKPIYVTDIRIAAGGRSLYQALESTGRVAIRDIHFATGKATILSESSEAIENVAKLLRDHSELKLLIEGHTDNTGNFEKNMQLSNERATAVKTYLMEKFKIDESRLETMGLGQSRPTTTNDTAEGKAENRRVEIVKL